MTMKQDRWTRRALLLIAALAVLLSGCTTYVTTQVTAFSNWNGSDAARTYAFARTPGQQNNLEQSTYEQIVANELATLSFRQVDEQQAHYLVGLLYSTRPDMVTVTQPAFVAPAPWPGPYWGRPFDPMWGPWGPYPAGYVSQTYPVYTHMLGIRITDRETGKEVYSVMARNTGDESSLVRAMPYLSRSALSDFPLGNGAVRTVRIPVDKNARAPNELAVGAPTQVNPAGTYKASP